GSTRGGGRRTLGAGAGARPARAVRRRQRPAPGGAGRRLRRQAQRRILLRARAVRRLRDQSQHRRRPVRQPGSRDLRPGRRPRMVRGGELPRVVPQKHHAGHGSRRLSDQLPQPSLPRPRARRRLGSLPGERRHRRRAALGRPDAQLGAPGTAVPGAHRARGPRSRSSLPHGPDRSGDGAGHAVTRPLPLLPAWLYGELAPRPGRWRQAVAMSAAATVALAIALALQIAYFPAPLLAFRALQPSIVCTWRNLLQRLIIIAAATLVTIPVVGVIVQLPWL